MPKPWSWISGGEPKYFLNNMVGVLEGGKLLRAWCTQRDITTQKEAQEGLRSSEAQLRLLTDALPVSIVYVDKERRYRFANRTALAWRQGPGETIIGKRVEDVLSEQAYQTVRDYLEQAFAGQVVRFERFIEYADGKRYTQNQLVPHLEEGEVQGVYGLVMDITRQVEARKEADRQRQRLNDLFLQAPAPICILDGADLVFELVNPACQQLFPGRKLLGKAILEALPELNGTPIWQTFRRVYQTGQTHEEKEVLIAVARYEDGALEDRYFHYIQQARYDWEGKVDGVVVFAFEVTEQVEARQKVEQSERQLQFLNEELASANEELRAANEEIQASNEELAGSNRQLTRINQDLDNFVYTASHDLKAPILNVEGLLRAMEKQLSQEISHNQTVQQIYQLLYGSVSRFKATIGDLTEVARISKESSEDVALITLAEILQEVLKDLEPQIQQAQAQVTVTLDCDDLLFSRKNLKSVLYNLISNALKYRSPDREPLVTIYCHTQEHYYLLTVQDNGLGMDMRQEEKIFALFKRLHNHVEGTGIGLYIVKKIVENAGGKIEVNSQVGVGSVFKVYFKR
jgi:PAS domain S-box-containing protein